MNAGTAKHWNAGYARRGSHGVSWFESSPDTSLALIELAGVGPDAAIVDAGGGASRLAGDLIERGYSDVTVVDLSSTALEEAKAELGPAAWKITWLAADVRDQDFQRRFDLWHDRAVFHFMVDDDDRAAYLTNLRRSLRPEGYLVLATFGPEGPTSCSGLPVARYGAEQMGEVLGGDFELIEERLHVHETPGGGEQQFQYALFRR